MIRALPLLLLSACSRLVPGDVPGHERVHYQGSHEGRSVALALAAFQIVLDEQRGERAGLSGLTIIEGDLPGEQTGETNGAEVRIEAGPLSGSALAHELMHVHLWRTVGDPDRDHEDGVGAWTIEHYAVEREAQRLMRECGL